MRLLDISVLIASADSQHPSHRAAFEWMRDLSSGWAPEKGQSQENAPRLLEWVGCHSAIPQQGISSDSPENSGILGLTPIMTP